MRSHHHQRAKSEEKNGVCASPGKISFIQGWGGDHRGLVRWLPTGSMPISQHPCQQDAEEIRDEKFGGAIHPICGCRDLPLQWIPTQMPCGEFRYGGRGISGDGLCTWERHARACSRVIKKSKKRRFCKRCGHFVRRLSHHQLSCYK